jgi:hypothetical protein
MRRVESAWRLQPDRARPGESRAREDLVFAALLKAWNGFVEAVADFRGGASSMNADAPVYVDELFYAESRNPQAHHVGERNGHQWCHMWSDDLERLHWMAGRIGLKRAWFQDKGPSRLTGIRFAHYDLVPSKRALALAFGAVEKDLASWIKEKVRPGLGNNHENTTTDTTNKVPPGVLPGPGGKPKAQSSFDFFQSADAGRKHFDAG